MKAFQVLGIAFVGFLIGVPFGATFVHELPGREDRFMRENRQILEQLRQVQEKLAKCETGKS